jgi:tetratricopeptide (TPR) repeat protein
MNAQNKLVFCFFLVFLIYGTQGQNTPELNPDVEKARALLMEHNYAQVISICNKNIGSSLKNKDPQSHSWFLSTKGMAYLDTINADSGVIFFEKSLAEAYSINYKKSICNCLYGLGKFYYRNSDYITAIKYFQLLNYYSANDPDKNYQLISNYYLSANYNLLNRHKLTISYGRKAAEIAFEMKDTSSYIKSLLSIGTQYFVLNNLDSNEFYCNKANDIYMHYSQKNRGIGSDIYNSFLKTQIIKKNYDKGIYYGKKAVTDCINNNELTSLNVFYDNLAICYSNKKMYDSAVFYYEKALDLELKYNYVDEYKMDLKELFYINKLANNTKKAFYYVEKYISADSLYQEEKGNAVDSLKTAFEFEKSKITLKADEEKLREVYKKKQISYLSIGIILLLLLTAVPYALYLRTMLKREKEKQNLLIQVKDSEIKALQSQMNPHFIFNSLNSVLEFISKSETEDAIKYLTKFSRLIRLVLEFSNRKSIFLSEEIELLRLYADLENIRSENGFTFALSMDKGLDPKNYEIPSMLLQPFIENSIIHGIFNKAKISEQENKIYKGDLKLSISKTEKFLKCEIEDNGAGREKAQEIKNSKSFNHLSLGMRITKDRLNLISQDACRIEYFDLKDKNNASLGTRVEILIPLLESF